MTCYRCNAWPCTCPDRQTIIHGDCRDIFPQLEPVDLVLTDPPYAHKHLGGRGISSGKPLYCDGVLQSMSNFDLSYYASVLLSAAPMLIAFHSRDLIPDYAALSRSAGRKYDLHVWHKVDAIPFTHNTWKSDLEYIALIWKRKPGWEKMAQSAYSKLYSTPYNRQKYGHPAGKPILLMSKYLRVLKPMSVIDPFMGSGTTLVAAKLLGRRGIGIEIEEKYCEVAANRLRQEVLNLGETPSSARG